MRRGRFFTLLKGVSSVDGNDPYSVVISAKELVN